MKRGLEALAALLAVLAGCQDDGGAMVLIDLKTDYVPGIEFTSVRVVVEDVRTGRPMMETRAAVLTQDYIQGVRVAELALGTPGTRAIETSLLTADGSVLASRRTHAIVQGTTAITVVVARGGEMRCATDDTCPALAACVDGVCASGVCLMAPLTAACSETEWCDIAAGGCRPIPGGAMAGDDGGMSVDEDAGTMMGTDSGTPAADAGPPDPVIPTAFRATRMDMSDPHVYARAPRGLCSMCLDGTDIANGRTQSLIDSNDRNVVLVMLPLEAAGMMVAHIHHHARCPSDTSCGPGSIPEVVTTVTRTGDQIVSAPVDFDWEFDGVPIPLVEVTFTATIDGDQLVDGEIRGFATEDAARDAELGSTGSLCDEPLTVYDVLRGGGGCRSGDDRDDLDGDGDDDGWWIHVDMVGQQVDWAD